MNEKESSEDSRHNSSRGGVFQRRGFSFFGLGLQDLIRYFFNGNASIAIIVLVLICLFLSREAVLFFPDHHHELTIYRKAGQEYVDYIKQEVDEYSLVYSKANIAYFAEVNESSKGEDVILTSFRGLQSSVENQLRRPWERTGDIADDLEGSRDDFEEEEDEVKKAELAVKVAELETALAGKQEELRAGIKTVLADKAIWKENASKSPGKEVRRQLEEALLYEVPGVGEGHPYIENLKQVSSEKKSAAAFRLADFKVTVKGMQDAGRPLKSFLNELREIGSANRSEIVKFSTAFSRRDALLEGAEKLKGAEAKAAKLAEANTIDLIEPDYDQLNLPLYNSRSTYREIISQFKTDMAAAMAALPKDPETKSARENLRVSRAHYDELTELIDKNTELIEHWNHRKDLPWWKAVTAFVCGKNWITNSSWHDFFGMLPLFTGSLLISVIALGIAVPFSIAGAIYVNQIASVREQNFVKPAIEFIQAIPSVVLGFFGILVLGEALRNLSQVEALSWIPGFPMSERLNMLTAGLLLAFMAVPTIFTLAEDALNNIPRTFAENSLAMGATRLQTVFRVIVPSALSGIIAAVLLGFGRVIGETMVVLLVAGNKIKIPDFTEGVGVVTQPAHTMTGIIAQELGEVDQGSIHWRALFMIGMVLFVISLVVNYSAQKVLKKFQKI